MSDEQYLFNAHEYPWHSPRYVLEAYDYLLTAYDQNAVIKEKVFEKAREMRAAAICLLGIWQIQDEHFMMQVSRDRSPDVRTMVLKEIKDKPNHGFFQEVELVALDDNSDETELIPFLERTKLSPRYAYDDKTIILVELKKNMTIPSYNEIHRQLEPLNPTPTVMILCRVHPTEHQYAVTQVWPIVELNSEVDVVKAANAYPSPHNLQLTRGMARKVMFSNSGKPKPTYYEVFGIDPKDIESFKRV